MFNCILVILLKYSVADYRGSQCNPSVLLVMNLKVCNTIFRQYMIYSGR